MRIVRLTWLMGTLLIGSLWGQAQSAQSKPGTLPDFPVQKSAQIGECTSPDATTRSLCNQATQESYRYLISAYQHRRSSFDWNLAADKIIFAVVILLVISGLVFAGIQFRIALTGNIAAQSGTSLPAKEGAPRETEPPTFRSDQQGQGSSRQSGGMATDLEFSTKGIKVSSSVLGVTVLLISMAFFYLYARYVYPVQEVHHDQPDVSQGSLK
jgi:hypothetical protein